MLTLKDLMIGDWFYWEINCKNYPTQVCEETFGLTNETISNFHPIPITKEILEKNGFVLNEVVKEYYIFRGIDNRVYICNDREYINSRNEWHVHIDSEDYCTIASCELTYVHELQNILRLCKIDKEIVV